jgi:hypothetical protein
MRTPYSRNGGILAGLLFTGLAIIFLAVIAGIVIARNVRIQTHDRNNGGEVSIDTPGGHLSIRGREYSDPKLTGIPMYPGARQLKDGGGAVFEWTSDDGATEKGFSVVGAEMFTRDPASEVISYYRDKLPNLMVIRERNGTTRLEYKEGGYKRIIAIHEKSDGTHIGVASVGEPASN